MRQASRHSESEAQSHLALQHQVLDEKRQKESLENPTDAMLEILNRIEERERERQSMSWQQQLQHFNTRKNSFSRSTSENLQNLSPNPLTPAMEDVIEMRQARISVDIDVPITPEPSDTDND